MSNKEFIEAIIESKRDSIIVLLILAWLFLISFITLEA